MKAGQLQEIRKDGIKTFIVRAGLPNATAVMYILPTRTLDQRQIVIRERKDADKISPHFAGALMNAWPAVTRMVMGTRPDGWDYVTLTVGKPSSWDGMQDQLERYLINIADHLKKHSIDTLIDFSKAGRQKSFVEWLDHFESKGLENYMVQQKAIIAVVNGQLAHDGGEIYHAGYHEDTKVLDLWLDGACEGCPGSRLTVERGLMNLFNAKAPEMEKPVARVNILKEKPASLKIS